MAKYFPEPPPFPISEEDQKFLDYMFRELNRISVALFTEVYLNLEKKYVAPTRPQDGDVSYADGTSWNPGAGMGVYAFLGTTWHKLNLGATDTITMGALTVSSLISTGLITTNGQVKFPATANPSADANTLDEYEEGTWTPLYVAGTGAYGGITYGANKLGTYVKIGQSVTINCLIYTDVVNLATAGGQLTITALPFSCGAPGGGLAIGYSANFVNRFPHDLQIGGTTLYVYGRIAADGASVSTLAATSVTLGAVATQNYLLFGGSYRANA